MLREVREIDTGGKYPAPSKAPQFIGFLINLFVSFLLVTVIIVVFTCSLF